MLLSPCRKNALRPFFYRRQPVIIARTLEWQRNLKIPSCRHFTGCPKKSASIEHIPVGTPIDLTPFNSPQSHSSIRQRLQLWDSENAGIYTPELSNGDMLGTSADTYNAMRQAGEVTLPPQEEQDQEDFGHPSRLGGDGLVDLGDSRMFLRSGDLVELTSTGYGQELAIFVRDLERQSQFYTMSGGYFHRRPKEVKFSVKGFVRSEELSDILPYLPTQDVPRNLEDKPQELQNNVPITVGRPLIQKMSRFWQQTEAAYQAAASRLDNAHKFLARKSEFRYATLQEIAHELFPPGFAKSDTGEFSAPVLYAVHRSLLRADVGINIPRQGTIRAGGHYEISSLAQVNTIRKVAHEVELYREDLIKGSQKSKVHQFVERARVVIDHSRECREVTPYGALGPLLGDSPQYQHSLKGDIFTSVDKEFLLFIESWVAFESFARASSYAGVGSTLLRAVSRYTDVSLDQTTGWTFMQEMGLIAPWESRAAYDLRLPQVSSLLSTKRLPTLEGIVPDKLASLRKDWGELPVFCIDDVTAHEIDDGVSIAPTDEANEYWVHIHIADPAAHIDPKSSAASAAQAMMTTVYLPMETVPMLHPDFTQGSVSLAPGRPSLTFSARMNLNGDILDTKITPGIVNNVVFMTHKNFGQFVGWDSSGGLETVQHDLGSTEVKHEASRPLVDPSQLSEAYQTDLKLLHRIANARGAKMKGRGTIDIVSDMPQISVSLKEPTKGGESGHSQRQDDPAVRIVHSKAENKLTVRDRIDTVARLMLIGNEVAARWCHARGVPIPYRVTPRNPDKESPGDYYRRVMVPAMKTSEGPSMPEISGYFRAIGNVQPSTTPGPHAAIAVDMVAKCTSPLRRYSDLLLHWQVEAALLKEAETGRSLIGNSNEDFFPFSKSSIDELLPLIDTRERSVTARSKEADRAWLCHFLLRAWKYKEADIQSPFPVLIRSVDLARKQLGGVLLTLRAGVTLGVTDFMPIEDVNVGDIFECEVRHIDMYHRSIDVKPLRRLSTGSNK